MLAEDVELCLTRHRWALEKLECLECGDMVNGHFRFALALGEMIVVVTHVSWYRLGWVKERHAWKLICICIVVCLAKSCTPSNNRRLRGASDRRGPREEHRQPMIVVDADVVLVVVFVMVAVAPNLRYAVAVCVVCEIMEAVP